MEPTRVIFIDMPRLLRELLREAVRDAGMEVLAELDTTDEAFRLLDAEPAGPLALVASDEDAGAVHELLARAPRARMLTIAADASRASLYALRPHRTLLGEASPAGLVAALRGDS